MQKKNYRSYGHYAPPHGALDCVCECVADGTTYSYPTAHVYTALYLHTLSHFYTASATDSDTDAIARTDRNSNQALLNQVRH